MTTQTLSSPSEVDTYTPIAKMVSLLLLMLVSCFFAAALFSYSSNDPAWVNSGNTSTDEYQNMMGALGAWISDLLLTGLGYSAYLIPLAGVYLTFRLWRENPIDLETLTFRALALVCGMIGVSILLTIHLNVEINSIAVTGGGMMGQFLVTKLLHLFSPSVLVLAAFVLTMFCLLLFLNTGPLTIIDGIGNLILGKKLLSKLSSTDSKSVKTKNRWFSKTKENAELNSETLQAKLRAISDIDDAEKTNTSKENKITSKFNDLSTSESVISETTNEAFVDTSAHFSREDETQKTDEQQSKSTPTITPPHYEKTAAQNLTDERYNQNNLQTTNEMPESIPSKSSEALLNETKRTSKRTISDLTALLRPNLLNVNKRKEPKLTPEADKSLSLNVNSNSNEQSAASILDSHEDPSARREPSLFSKDLKSNSPRNEETVHDGREYVQTTQPESTDTDMDQINAEIDALKKASIHQDNSLEAKTYRAESAFARDENPAERFSQPAAPMQARREELSRPIASPSRKPVNPDIQQKIVSDILEDSERQAKLRHAPLQPTKVTHVDAPEREVAKTVSSIPLSTASNVIAGNAPEKETTTSSSSKFVEQLDAQMKSETSDIINNTLSEDDSSLPKSESSNQIPEKADDNSRETVIEAIPFSVSSHERVDQASAGSPSENTQLSNQPEEKSAISKNSLISTRNANVGLEAHDTVAHSSNNLSSEAQKKQTNPQENAAGLRVNIGQAYEATQQASQVPTSTVTHHQLPSIDLLDNAAPLNASYTEDDLRDMAVVLETTLKEFKLDVTVMNISPGPVITRFEMDLAPGVQASKISRLSNDLARALAVSSVRVEEVIAGSSYIGLEVPNMNRQTVYLKDIFKSKAFQSSKSPMTLALGTNISGQPIVTDLKKMPHLLVAGTTGSGKSVSINTMLLSMLYKATPRDLRLIMVDPKMLEMSMYEDIPHLLTPVITDMEDAENALTWAVAEMERRYKLMAAMKIRKIESFNDIIDEAAARGETVKDPLWEPNEAVGYTHHPSLERLPYIVIVIDELADMMMVVGKQVEQLIARLTQKARAAGIHMIIATQRPSTDVLTGLIKANVPTRIAFQVSSGTDSKVIIDTVGAQNLLGNGDMLYVPAGSSHPNRLHGAFVNDQETDRVTDFLRETGEPDYINSITSKQSPEDLGAFGAADIEKSDSDDPLYSDAVEIVLTSGKASISSVQRQLRIGYNRAARMIEQMQADGIVSEPVNGMRKVLRGH